MFQKTASFSYMNYKLIILLKAALGFPSAILFQMFV